MDSLPHVPQKAPRSIYSIDEIAAIDGPIADEYGAEGVWLFGSYARGEADRDSDIDMVVRPGKDWRIKVGVFWRAIPHALGKEVDIALDSDRSFMEHISDDLVKIY